MTATAIREAIDSGKPFRLRSGDGAVIDVRTRDHAFLNPTGRLIVVFTDDDGARVLDVALVTAIVSQYEASDRGFGISSPAARSPSMWNSIA
jgi:hypothetical protein